MRTIERSTALHGKVKRYFGALLDNVCVEAFFLVGRELVGQGCRGCEAREGAQEGQEGEEDEHGGRAAAAVLDELSRWLNGGPRCGVNACWQWSRG